MNTVDMVYDARGREVKLPYLPWIGADIEYKNWAYARCGDDFVTPSEAKLYVHQYEEYSSDIGPLRKHQSWRIAPV